MLNRIFKRFLKHSSETKYNIDGFDIELPENHMLPNFQKSFCYYDRIHPFIAKMLKDGGAGKWIIDIGANIGDTVYAMLKHTQANFLCIEPDSDYFSLLEKNILKLENQYKLRVKCVNAFVVLDTLINNITTQKKDGTAHKISIDKSDDKIKTFTLKDIINYYDINVTDIDLIKVDTDGYDWECIMSMGDYLIENDIFLYWENYLETGNDIQLKGYISLVDYLKDSGYTNFFCFDNFGNYISKGDYKFLLDMNHYLYRLNEKKTQRTFYYVDVLACKNNKLQAVQDMINNFYEM